jgi:SAM-dependent methyltransferase
MTHAAGDALPIPPEQLRFMGEDEIKFLKIGDALVAELRDVAGLGDDAAVLDVGCGYGRIAHALLRSGFVGQYRGFDILPKHVAWCVEHLSGPHTEFWHVDIQNDRYNPTGKESATSVDLGLQRDSADVVLATSVFTHMWPAEIRNYLGHVAKALRPGGRAYLTFFLMNETWRKLDRAGLPTFPLPHAADDGHYRFMNPDNPLHVIAYEQGWVEAQMRAAGLEVIDVRLGFWAGRKGTTNLQDAVVVRRAPNARAGGARRRAPWLRSART